MQYVGGDKIQVAKKFIEGISARFPGKLTFLINDAPVWSSPEAFSIRRRVWNLPLLAQYLAPDDDQRRKLEQEGKAHYIYDLDKNLLNKLIETHIPAYMKWCIQGSVMYFANNKSIDPPQTVIKASPKEDMDINEMFKTFVESSFVKASHKYPISVQEIKEVFLLQEGLDIEIDSKTTDIFHKIMKAVFVIEKTRARGFEHVKSIRSRFPTRTVYSLQSGYSGIAYKPGLLGATVNNLRAQNKDDKRPRISEAEVHVESDGDEDEIMGSV